MRHVEKMVIGVLLGCSPAYAETGKAVLKPTAEGSSIAGSAQFTDSAEGLKVLVSISQAPPGKHGLHIHQFGSCEDGAKAAGGHYNPDNVMHGFLVTDGFSKAHAGDFGNIEVGPDGTGRLELTIPGLNLAGGKHTIGGRAVVLHEKPDDFGQPTGNAGGRIGCGTIAITSD